MIINLGKEKEGVVPQDNLDELIRDDDDDRFYVMLLHRMHRRKVMGGEEGCTTLLSILFLQKQ